MSEQQRKWKPPADGNVCEICGHRYNKHSDEGDFCPAEDAPIMGVLKQIRDVLKENEMYFCFDRISEEIYLVDKHRNELRADVREPMPKWCELCGEEMKDAQNEDQCDECAKKNGVYTDHEDVEPK